jgi:hypothetical protein
MAKVFVNKIDPFQSDEWKLVRFVERLFKSEFKDKGSFFLTLPADPAFGHFGSHHSLMMQGVGGLLIFGEKPSDGSPKEEDESIIMFFPAHNNGERMILFDPAYLPYFKSRFNLLRGYSAIIIDVIDMTTWSVPNEYLIGNNLRRAKKKPLL